MPLGRDAVVNARGVAAPVMVMFCGPDTVCAGLLESVALTVSGESPAIDGVPLTTQPVRVNPVGSVPAVNTQL